MNVGQQVTVLTGPKDPLEITLQPHAVIVAVERGKNGRRYRVGHPPARAAFGPYTEADLVPGWTDVR